MPWTVYWYEKPDRAAVWTGTWMATAPYFREWTWVALEGFEEY
jgi:hypothetical protein